MNEIESRVSSTNAETRPRLDWIDLAKGLGLFLVIIGHTLTDAPNPAKADQAIELSGLTVASCVHRLIFSFHMPLFFFLSFLCSKLPADTKDFWRKFKRYSLLFIGTYFLVLVIDSLYIWVYRAQPLGIVLHKKLLYTFSLKEGPTWFLVVLWWIRVIYEWLGLHVKSFRLQVGICLALATLSSLCPTVAHLPFGIGTAFIALYFVCFGTYFQRRGGIKRGSPTEMAVYASIWLGLTAVYIIFGSSEFDMNDRQYPCFPLNIIAACAGIVVVCNLCQALVPLDRKKIVVWLGRYSLWLLSVHALDHIWDFLWVGLDSVWVQALVRVAADSAITFLVVKAVDVCKSRIAT